MTAEPEDGLTVSVLGGVEDISAQDWRTLAAGRGFYSSPRWLHFVEDDPRYDAWYLVARRGPDLLGVMPVYLPSGHVRAGVDGYYDPSAVFNTPAGVGDPARWRPALLAGGRTGYETELLLRPGLPAGTRRCVLKQMLTRLRLLATAWDVPAIAFMYLTPAAVAELAPVVGTPPLLVDLTAAIPLEGCDSFDDYLGRLTGHRRRRVRHEIQEFRSSGCAIRRVRPSDGIGILAPLMAEHHHRYGHDDSTEMLATHLAKHAEHLDDLGHLLVCEDAGTPVGALLAYEWEHAWYARAVGIADGLRGQACTYFNLVFYEPIRLAIERGVTRYLLGPSTVGAKVKRGATLEARWSLLTGGPALADDVRALSDGWNERQWSQWEARLREIGCWAPLDV
ncbi:MAG: GNAT family N-acetyltransferase [Micromonosporaceae bacterium]